MLTTGQAYEKIIVYLIFIILRAYENILLHQLRTQPFSTTQVVHNAGLQPAQGARSQR